jgi:DNA-binding response OmpR family regulator
MAESQPRRPCVLLIDDDPGLVAALTDALQLVSGYEVVVAVDGADGLERFMAVRPTCVVVDVRMPRVNGYQFVRALRADAETAQTPIIILSALVQEHQQFAGLLTGADVYLEKPVTLTDLLAAIETAIRLSCSDRSANLNALIPETQER